MYPLFFTRLWRPSKYLGCGESVKAYGGGQCHIQVCRYAKPGNCGMSTYNSTDGDNWLVPMLKGEWTEILDSAHHFSQSRYH